MKAHLTKSCIVVVAFNLAACTTDATAPAAGTGPAIAQDAMPEYCQGAAATRYGVTAEAISTDPAVPADGGFEVKGTSVGGSEGSKIFNCRFDSSGKFLGVMAGISAS